jgi:hypothetical protein
LFGSLRFIVTRCRLANKFLRQEHAVEMSDLLIMCSDFDVPRWLFMLWYISICICVDRRRKNGRIHPFRASIAQLRFIVVVVEILLLATDNTEAAQE